MSRSSEVSLTCPCGTTFSARLYTTVNVSLEPRLLYQLLAGTLNTATCPNCGRKAASAQPFIYHDMRRGLFAYVHPHEEVAEEEREELLATLRRNYALAVAESERIQPLRAHDTSERQGEWPEVRPRVRRRTPGEDLARIEPEVPPMQIIFGEGNLISLVESLLDPEERLGRVALSTRGGAAERARLLEIVERMAEEMDCLVDAEDAEEEYTVWVYGARARTDALARALRGAWRS